MPDISQNMLPHWCVVWKRSDTKTRHGQARILSPINVRCRWKINDRLDVNQDQSMEHIPRSVPMNQSIPLGSYVWGRGRIGDLPSSPTYYEVVALNETPDIRGNSPTYSVELGKASTSLPGIV